MRGIYATPPGQYTARKLKPGKQRDKMPSKQSHALKKGDDIEAAVRQVLADVLALAPETAEKLDADSPLFGAIPELDSMAVAGLLTELEDRLGIVIDDDEVDGELFATFGALTRFAARKTGAR